MSKLKRIGWCFAVSVILCAAGWLSAVGEAGAMTLPELRPPEFETPPVIDGVVTESVWAAAAVFSLTNAVDSSGIPLFATTARMGYDAMYVYIAVTCAVPAGADAEQADRVELFLGTSPLHYFNFVLTRAGEATQQSVIRGELDATWRTSWAYAVQDDGHGWSAEIALPWEILARSVLPEDQLRFNAARVAGKETRMPHTVRLLQETNATREVPAILSWAPLGDADQKRGLHAGEKFGRLVELKRQAIKKTKSRLKAAAIISPYQADGAGYYYRLELVVENQTAARVILPVLVRETVRQYGPSASGELSGRMSSGKSGSAPDTVDEPAARDLAVITMPAWSMATNSIAVNTPDALPRRIEVGVNHDSITQAWITADGESLLTPGVRKLAGAELAEYGCNPKKIGNPIGGGAGYDRVVTGGTHVVSGARELLELLDNLTNASPDAPGVIFIPSDTEIDLTGRFDPSVRRGSYPFPFMFLPAGWTLAGNRGENGAPGALLKLEFTDEELPALRAGKSTHPYAGKALIGLGEGARLTGLRVRGPDPAVLERNYAELPPSRFNAVYTMGQNTEVDNCEISHFHWAGVNVCHPGTRVRHNYLFDLHAYPVVVGGDAGGALIAGNRIAWSWHAIAGGGQQGSGYEAEHNEFMHVGPGGPAHAVDMHAWRGMMKGHGSEYPYLSIAGDRMIIRHNTFVDDHAQIKAYRVRQMQADAPATPSHCVLIRGVPRELALVESNRLVNPAPDKACNITDNVSAPPGKFDRANFWVRDNIYGLENILIPAPMETRPVIRFVHPGLTIPRVERNYSTRHANLLQPDEKLPVAVALEAMPPLKIQRVTVSAGNEDVASRELFADKRPPRPGEIVLDAADWGAGCYVLTVEVEDERGIAGRHSTSFTVGSAPK